jgi:hypothetical protein
MPRFTGMGNLARSVIGRAKMGGDYVLSNSLARYSTIAAGSAVAAYGYANDRPMLGGLGLAAAGGTAFGSAYRGAFGARAQGYAMNAVAFGKGAMAGARGQWSKFRGGGRPMRNVGQRALPPTVGPSGPGQWQM